MSITLIIIIITVIVSAVAFNNSDLLAKLQFSPYQTYHRKEYYRLFSHALVHADWLHLIVNMLVFYSFGTNVESSFKYLEAEGFMSNSQVWYIGLYVVSIAAASLITLKKYKDDFAYNAVGASGGVSAVTFCAIFLNPFGKIYLYFIPMPGIIFGVLYLIYSQYMSKRNMDNVNHDAHFMGAVFGFLFPLLIDWKFIYIFINQLINR
jgi:membrane associated rhomboid family serine protease